MKQIDEQIKEFWEWCGLHLREVAYQGKTWNEWTNDDGGFESRYTPAIDLNNLFKYAVPKLDYVDLLKNYSGYHCVVMEQDKIYDNGLVFDDPALALFWAMYEVMK